MLKNAATSQLGIDLNELSPDTLAYYAALAQVARSAPDVARAIVAEIRSQRSYLKLIASENYCSLATQCAMGNLLTDKYSEGFPRHRFYAGCENVDDIEEAAVEEAKKLFGVEHAYVQPHSGADANLIAYWAILRQRVQLPWLAAKGESDPGKLSREDWEVLRRECHDQRLLSLELYSGGHLTHGYRHNVSGQMFDVYHYGVSRETGRLDYDAIEQQLLEIRPLILVVGYSAYPRAINFARMRQAADKVGAVLMVDMAHFAGLVAGGVFTGAESPSAYAHVITSTTHKTLRGPRGGLVLCTEEFRESVDKGCPLVIGGPLPHVMAAKAVAFREAAAPEFKVYTRRIVENCRALAAECIKLGLQVVTGGTDNHLLQIDVRPFGLTGRQAEQALLECHVTLNRNTLPFDTNGPWYTSGLRLGTAAVTTLGMGTDEMREIAAILQLALSNMKPEVTTKADGTTVASKAKYVIDPAVVQSAARRVQDLLKRFPLYPALDLDLLESRFS